MEHKTRLTIFINADSNNACHFVEKLLALIRFIFRRHQFTTTTRDRVFLKRFRSVVHSHCTILSQKITRS